jgi:hypothetical protein
MSDCAAEVALVGWPCRLTACLDAALIPSITLTKVSRTQERASGDAAVRYLVTELAL